VPDTVFALFCFLNICYLLSLCFFIEYKAKYNCKEMLLWLIYIQFQMALHVNNTNNKCPSKKIRRPCLAGGSEVLWYVLLLAGEDVSWGGGVRRQAGPPWGAGARRFRRIFNRREEKEGLELLERGLSGCTYIRYTLLTPSSGESDLSYNQFARPSFLYEEIRIACRNEKLCSAEDCWCVECFIFRRSVSLEMTDFC
jgi:hypothetical protein